MNYKHLVHYHYEKAFDFAILFVEQEARRVLSTHSNLINFVCAMGSITFETNTEERIDNYYNQRRYTQKFFEFIDYWDDVLKISGYPLRLDKQSDGTIKKTTMW